MKLDRLFETAQLKPAPAPPPPSQQMRSLRSPCKPTRTLWSARARSTSPSLITVKEVSSPGVRGPGPAPPNCASVSQVQETWRPDPWQRVGWIGPAVCRWNTATTPVMPCCSVTVGTVGCPLSGMHQPVTPPVPSQFFLSFFFLFFSFCCMTVHPAGAAACSSLLVHGFGLPVQPLLLSRSGRTYRPRKTPEWSIYTVLSLWVYILCIYIYFFILEFFAGWRFSFMAGMEFYFLLCLKQLNFIMWSNLRSCIVFTIDNFI